MRNSDSKEKGDDYSFFSLRVRRKELEDGVRYLKVPSKFQTPFSFPSLFPVFQKGRNLLVLRRNPNYIRFSIEKEITVKELSVHQRTLRISPNTTRKTVNQQIQEWWVRAEDVRYDLTTGKDTSKGLGSDRQESLSQKISTEWQPREIVYF